MDRQEAERRQRMRPSTTLDVMSYAAPWGLGQVGADHAFIVITDNQTGMKWVARGGPSHANPIDIARAINRGEWNAIAEVRPFEQSTEYKVLQKGDKVVRPLHTTIVPDITGAELAELAAKEAATLNAAGRGYGGDYNSNSMASELYGSMTGQRFTGEGLFGSRSDVEPGVPASRKRADDRMPIDEWMRNRAQDARELFGF